MEVPWLAPLAYTFSFIAIIGLIVLNVALTTYDAIIVTVDNYNTTQTLWYHRFTRHPSPGSQCSSYNLTIGQQFYTTNNVMTYTLLSIDGGKKIFPYTGRPLGDCDVISATIDADLVATTVSYIAYVACNSTGLRITAKIEYRWSRLPSLEDNGPTSPGESFFDPGPGENQAGHFVGYAFGQASLSLKALLQIPPTHANSETPRRISIQGLPSCTRHPGYASLVSDYCNDDSNEPVTWLYGGGLDVYFGFANGTELTRYNEDNQTTGPYWVNLATAYDSPRHRVNISGTYYPAITNALQLLHSAVRLDFGRILPNNVYLNMTMMNQTLQNPFPQDIEGGHWATTLNNLAAPANFAQYNMSDFLQGNSTYINGEYQCRFWYSVGWARAAVNVMVATLSLFTSGWGFAMLVIAFFVSRTPESNYCLGHIEAKRGKGLGSNQELRANSLTMGGSETTIAVV